MIIFTAPETWPFGAALAVMVGLSIVEGAGLMLAHSPSHILESLLPDMPDGVEGPLGWLHVGKDAAREAEQQAISITVAAAAEREAAENRALALRVEADAKKAAALAEAEGISAINEAKNRLGAAQIDLAVRLQLIQSLPLIIQQSVKPLEKIESIRLFQVNGMPTGNGAGGAGQAGGSGGASTLPEQVVNSALQYQVAKPIVDAIMKDAGLSNPSLTGIAESVAAMVAMPQVAVAAAPHAEPQP